MRVIFHIALLILYIAASNSSIISDVRDSLRSYFTNLIKQGETAPARDIRIQDNQEPPNDKATFDIHTEEGAESQQPKAIIRIFKSRDNNDDTGSGEDEKMQKILRSENTVARNDQAERYGLDETMNSIRRQIKRSRKISKLTDWLKKQMEVSQTVLKADPLNLVTVRPLRVSCAGKKYNQPVGFCILTEQCDPEDRLHSGNECGSTNFVCCSIRIENIDASEAEEGTKDLVDYDKETGLKKERILMQKRINLKERTSKKNGYDPFNLEQMNRVVEKKPRHMPLNSFRRGLNTPKKSEMMSASSALSESSSTEMKDWKLDWEQDWIKKKIEAINSTEPKGDVVNMVAARPWGVACGDPDQQDLPWGTCMLPAECEPEFRIFRGDYICSRTQFVCCAVQQADYDMNQAFDASFYDSGLTTSSDERRNKGKGSSEMRLRKIMRDKRRRRKQRHARKKKIKKSIQRMVKDIKKILTRQYTNMSTQKKRKASQLKNFIKDLKKKYKQDRTVANNIDEIGLLKMDARLVKKLMKMRDMNVEFVKNETFRNAINDGVMTRNTARMLVQAYPDLKPFMGNFTRRSGNVMKLMDDLDH